MKSAIGRIDVRFITCPECGDVIQTDLSAQVITCQKCFFENKVAARDLGQLAVKQFENIPEEKRIELLKGQLDRRWRCEEEILAFCDEKGCIVSEKLNDAHSYLGLKLNNIEKMSPDDLDKFSSFTFKLCNFYLAKGQKKEGRAIYERLVDVITEPRFKQHIINIFAQLAIGEDDWENAQKWLSFMDERPTHIWADTEYRFLKSEIAIHDKQWEIVLNTLGTESRAVPITKGNEKFLELFRAYSIYKTEGEKAAIERLIKYLYVLGPSAVPKLKKVIKTRKYILDENACLLLLKEAERKMYEKKAAIERSHLSPSAIRMDYILCGIAFLVLMGVLVLSYLDYQDGRKSPFQGLYLELPVFFIFTGYYLYAANQKKNGFKQALKTFYYSKQVGTAIVRQNLLHTHPAQYFTSFEIEYEKKGQKIIEKTLPVWRTEANEKLKPGDKIPIKFPNRPVIVNLPIIDI